MATRKITIKEFAEQLGVSTATVSRAFGSSGRISAKTRRHIIAKAAESGYYANIHARSLTRRGGGTVALFYPTQNSEEPDYFISEIMFSINRSLQQLGKGLQITPIADELQEANYEESRRMILDGSASGIVVVAGSRASEGLVETARQHGLPWVVVGHMSGVEHNVVWFDNEYGAFQAGRYFRNTGRHCPAYVSGFMDRRKKRGFVKGLEIPETALALIRGGSSFREGGLAFEQLMATRPETDCVLCANDVLAMGFIKSALTAGKRIPRDIAIIGFDDIRPSRYFTPALSSVSLKLNDIGNRAVSMLARLLQGAESMQAETVACDLILRESS